MFYYNLIQAVKSLTRHQLFTLLNLIGFSIGLAACMVLAIYIYQERSMNRCYPDYQRIYRIEDMTNQSAMLDYELVSMLKGRLPELQYVAPLTGSVGKAGVYSEGAQQAVFAHGVEATTNDFFSVFGVQVLQGNPSEPLSDVHSAVITRSLATRLYGSTDALGKDVWYRNTPLTVTAIIEDWPSNSTMDTELIVHSQMPGSPTAQECGPDCRTPMMLFVQLPHGVSVQQVQRTLNTVLPKNKLNTTELRLFPLADIYLLSPAARLQNDFWAKGNSMMMAVYLAIVISILWLSVFNYVNFTLSRQLSTLKQLGIRRAAGAHLGQLRGMYFTEVGIMLLLALLLAVLAVMAVLPLASAVLGTSLLLATLWQPYMLLSLVATSVILLLVATLTPLYLVSKLDIARLFANGGHRLSKQRVPMLLSVLQMAVSIGLLVAVVTINLQLRYARHAAVGFNKKHLVALRSYAKGNGQQGLGILKKKIVQLPFVTHASCSGFAPGYINMSMGSQELDEVGNSVNIGFQTMMIDQDFISTLGITLERGTVFASPQQADGNCYINTTACKQLGWTTFEGKHILGGALEVAGVVADVGIGSALYPSEPLCLIWSSESTSNTLTVRLAPGNTAEQMAELERLWRQTLPTEPFDYVFYDDLFDSFYRKEQRQAQAITLFSIIALVITCMGLLGQVFQAAMARVREIGIRKVNGATRLSVMMLFGRSLLLRVSVALVLAVPVAYYAMYRWLQTFAYKVPLSWWIFALAGLGTLLVAGITVGLISWRAANINPTEALKVA